MLLLVLREWLAVHASGLGSVIGRQVPRHLTHSCLTSSAFIWIGLGGCLISGGWWTPAIDVSLCAITRGTKRGTAPAVRSGCVASPVSKEPRFATDVWWCNPGVYRARLLASELSPMASVTGWVFTKRQIASCFVRKTSHMRTWKALASNTFSCHQGLSKQHLAPSASACDRL